MSYERAHHDDEEFAEPAPLPVDDESDESAVTAGHDDSLGHDARTPTGEHATAANVFELDSAGTAAVLATLPPAPDATAAPAASSSSYNPLAYLSSLLTHDSWAEMFWATASNQQRLCQFMYNHSLKLSCATQIICILLFLIVEPTAIKSHVAFTPAMGFLLVLCQLVQLLVMVLSHVGMLRELKALYVRPGKVWNMYVSVVLSFAALYFTFFCFHRPSFTLDGYAASGEDDVDPADPGGFYEDLETTNKIPPVFIYFLYFSGAIMTSVGFGDISPVSFYAQAATNAQMLMGTMYHVGVFGLTLSHFRTFQRAAAAREAAELAAGAGRPLVLRWWGRFLAQGWVVRLRSHRYTNTFKKFCIKYLVLVSLLFQTLNTALLFSIPDPFRSLKPSDAGYTHKVVVLTFITLFQTGMFVGVMWISIRLVKKINNKDITPGFLIQSFLATALLFGGIYFVLFAATPSHQFSHHSSFDLTVFEVLYVFVHFSFTVMTTTGFGDVYARGVVARLFVLAQMLISILYSAVIIGLGTSQLIDIQAQKAEADFKEKEAEAEEKLKLELQRIAAQRQANQQQQQQLQHEGAQQAEDQWDQRADDQSSQFDTV